MAISTAAQPTPIVSVNSGLPFVNANGSLTNSGSLALQQMHDYIVNMSRVIPCNAKTSLNVITLTMLPVQPTVSQYASYDTYAFVADATSSGNLSAMVVTSSPGGTLPTLNVYKTNGSARAASNDVTQNLQYFLTYVDTLNSGSGGFVLR